MLNNLTNFFNLIKARMTKTTLENEDLIATGTRDTSYGGSYKPTAIAYSDLRDQIVAAVPSGVTAVTGTSPVVSSGGTTPAISMPAATTSVSGHLRSSDWNTFNNKQAALVSGTNIKTVNSNTLLGSGDIAVQPTLVSGTNIRTVNGNTLLGSSDIAVQATLVSGTNIKTVNGNNILGSGDIAIAGGIAGIHIPFGVASGNYYTNTIDAAASTNTVGISGTGLLGLTPFRPSVSFTATSFSINVTSLTGGGNSGRVVIYSGNQDGGVTRVVNATLNILATGLSTVSQSFNFVAGTTYWMGWNCNFYQGNQIMTACRDSNMAPLMLKFPFTTPDYAFGYSTTSFTTGTPPAAIDLSTFTKTNTNCVQIFITA